MIGENNHSACVNAWIERAAKGLRSEQLVQAFDRAFSALWHRAYQTLGDVTLTAIVDRVLYDAAQRYAFLAVLRVDAAGLRCQELGETAGSLPQDQLAAGIRFVLVELLRILGSLTGEILTPALHAELAEVAPAHPSPPEQESAHGRGSHPSPPSPASTKG